METLAKKMEVQRITKLLSKGDTNVKTAKNALETYILYLAPYKQNSKGINLCAGASEGCIKGCLFTSGMGKFSNVQMSRINKSNFYVNDRQGFLLQLLKELRNANKKALKKGEKIAIRLNGTSDVDFIGQIKMNFNVDVLTEFSGLVFYDYTKILGKVKKYQGQNYFLTFSRSENTSIEEIKEAISYGANVSAVFKDELPAYFNGIKVIDGDASDIVMIYNRGQILGLKAKGDAKKDTSGFVIR